jgi:excisionase family DNA binding protein
VDAMQSTEYLTVREAAEYLKVSPSTLNKRRVSGNSCPYIKVGRSVRYRISDLDAFMAAQLRKSTSDNGQK